MKKIFLIGVLIIIFNNAISQENKKKIYFLADSTKLNLSKKHKAIDIKWTTPFHYSFIFKTDYKAPYYNYLEFSSFINKKNPKTKIELKKPKYLYTTLKELLSIVRDNPQYFNDIYDLYIIELLPGYKYQTNKVELTPQNAPTYDSVTLKGKQQ